jgi:hypothetical protein
MRSDNLFNKRKSKSARELARKSPKRNPKLKVLIVCEGQKTEPNYFMELRDHYELNSTFIKITGDCGSSPKSVIQHAQKIFKLSQGDNDPYDKVYCVIDKDCHSDYEAVRNKIYNLHPKGVFVLINSVPCFEYWLLLHHQYTTAAYSPLPGNSVANQVLGQLKKFLPLYSKGQQDLFKQLLSLLSKAIINSKSALEAANISGTDMPSTNIHKLVEFLQDLAKES